MKKYALLFVTFVFLLTGTSRAATGTDFINAIKSFVQTGLANADSHFATLRGTPIQMHPGQHYLVRSAFGVFLPTCHISGYLPPELPRGEWVLSCTSPGLRTANLNQLRGDVYQGVIQALPICFTRTLNPLLLNDETFRWDCHDGHSLSVDVTSTPLNNGELQFLLEVYEYVDSRPPQATTPTPTPAPSPTPTVAPVEIRLLKPVPTIDMGGITVPYVEYATLDLAEHLSIVKGSATVPRAVEIIKGGNEMPTYFPFWHYAGKQSQNGMPTISIWVCGNLSAPEQGAALKDGVLMGLLDSGLGGAALQKAYGIANAADAALGANTSDPFLNRRKLIFMIAPYFQ